MQTLLAKLICAVIAMERKNERTCSQNHREQEADGRKRAVRNRRRLASFASKEISG